MEKIAKEPQLTEFDMSIATLMRINDLIRMLHQLSLEFSPNITTKELYIRTLDRIYVEASIKMDDDEITKAKEFQQNISAIKIKWGRDLLLPFKGPNNVNLKYTEGWSELAFAGREYELFLMKTMERHNMLLKDQRKVEDSIV